MFNYRGDVSFLLILLLTATAAKTPNKLSDQWPTIGQTTMTKLNSKTLPGNLLPNFLFMQGSIEGGAVGVKIGGGRGLKKPFTPDDTCTDDIFEGASEDLRSPQLPYLTQDLWTCARESEDLPAWTLETDDLLVTITPQYSGKIWSIYDKQRKRELLYNNRAHQPANIGALKSWAAGGCEFNWSPGIIGHSAFSETQVYLARIDTDRGSMLRVYEYDRYNSTAWQVDIMIANGSVLIHPRVTNPTDCDLRGYWWTCVAMEATEKTRIFAPATHVAQTSRKDAQREEISMRDSPWPTYSNGIENATFKGYDGSVPTDNSYIANHQIGDMFLRIPKEVYTPYIASTEDDGYVLVHGHPLNGTKFFTWGQSGPGHFMQDFLAGGGKRLGDYTELQVGPAPTQMQTFPLPKQSILEWTEWFKGFDGSHDVLRGTDYKAALESIDSWIQSPEGMQREATEDWDLFFSQHAQDEPAEILVAGQPWGALEEKRLGKKLAEGLIFTLPAEGTSEYLEIQPWIELIEKGSFSTSSLEILPLSYQTTDPWFSLLLQSAGLNEISIKDYVFLRKEQGENEISSSLTWLHALHLGINLVERGEIELPRQYFQQSIEAFRNPIAYRCLAVLATDYHTAWSYYVSAWATLHSDFPSDPSYDRLTANLVFEMSSLLQQQGWWDIAAWYLEDVPENQREIDVYITLHIKYLLYQNEFDGAISLLAKNCFPTYASARDDLINMWFEAQEGKANAQNALERHKARIASPPPENIGCQYAAEFCSTYW